MALSFRMQSLGSIPEDFALGQVWEVELGTTLPAAVIGRRAQFDELIWDADGGFAPPWLANSALGGDEDSGYVLLLQRTAFSGAGLALFSLAAVDSDGGEGAPTGPAGGDLAGTYPNPTLGSAKTAAILASADTAADAGDVTTLATAQAYTVAALTNTPAYRGHSVSNVTTAPTTWGGLSTLCTVVDDTQQDVSRSGSAFTFAKAGTYFVTLGTNQATDGVTATYIGFRFRRSTTALLSRIFYHNPNNTATEPLELTGMITVAAGDVVSVELARSAGSSGSWANATLDGQTCSTMNLAMVRVSL